MGILLILSTMVKCRVCLKKYSTLSSVKRHLREIHGPNKICPFCFNYFGRLNAHLTSCKRYQRYQFTKLKIIGGEIYFINDTKKHNSQKIDNTIIKPIISKNAKRINKTKIIIYFPI